MKRSSNYLNYASNTLVSEWVNRKRIKKMLPMMDPEDNNDKERVEEDLSHFLEDMENCIQHSVVNVVAKDNHIYFRADVSKKSVEKLVDLLDSRNKEYEKIKFNNRGYIKNITPNPIYLHITSNGGDLLMGFLAVDAIQNSKVPVYTIVEGTAASAASLMAVAGEKRYMSANSHHLIHQLSSGCWGKFAEIEDDYNNCKKFMEKIVDIYVKNTTMTKKHIEAQLKHDIWWESDECLKNGIIDAVWK